MDPVIKNLESVMKDRSITPIALMRMSDLPDSTVITLFLQRRYSGAAIEKILMSLNLTFQELLSYKARKKTGKSRSKNAPAAEFRTPASRSLLRLNPVYPAASGADFRAPGKGVSFSFLGRLVPNPDAAADKNHPEGLEEPDPRKGDLPPRPSGSSDSDDA